MVTDSSPRLADATDTTKRAGRAARKHVQQQLVGKQGQHGHSPLSTDPVKALIWLCELDNNWLLQGLLTTRLTQIYRSTARELEFLSAVVLGRSVEWSTIVEFWREKIG